MKFDRLKNFLDEYLPMLGVPGSDTMICRHHEVLFRYQSGYDSLKEKTPVRPDAIYKMYSCSKVSTVVAAMQLIECGEILLTDPLYAYFPEYREMTVRDAETGEIRPAKNPILVRDLFTMSSGLDYNIRRPSIERVRRETDGRCPTLDIVRALAGDPLCFDPGTHYRYSLSHDVLGGLVELVSGQRFSEYLQENIFDPLGMKDTFFRVPEEKCARRAVQYDFEPHTNIPREIGIDENNYVFGPEYEAGGAGLHSTVEDQMQLADALANFGVGKSGARILSSRSVNVMRRNQLDDARLAEFAVRHHVGYGYGLGVRTNMHPELAANLSTVGEFGWDGARNSYLSADPDAGIAIFHAEHTGGLHAVLIPRLRNVIYSCLDD